MNIEYEILSEELKKESIERKLSELNAKNNQLQKIFEAGEVTYKTFYSTGILLTVAYFVGCAVIDLSILEFILFFVPYQIVNATISVINAYLKENSIKKKIDKNNIKIDDFEKQKKLCLEKIKEFEETLKNDKTMKDEGEVFSKQETLDALREMKTALVDAKNDEESLTKKSNKKL